MDSFGANGIVPVVVAMCAIFIAIALWRIHLAARGRNAADDGPAPPQV
jgi:hypothetical protein